MRSNIFRNPDQIRYAAQLAYRERQPKRARKLNALADHIEAVDRYPGQAEPYTKRIAALGIVGALMLASTAANAYVVKVDTALPTNATLFDDYAGKSGTFDTSIGVFSGDGVVYAAGTNGPYGVAPSPNGAYLAVPGLETLTLSAPATSFSFLWGSVDDPALDGVQNSVSLGGLTIDGASILGIMDDLSGFRSAWVTVSGLPAFSSVEFSSSSPAFEFALKGAGASPVPEPSTWAMMLMGLAGFSCLAFRRGAGRAVTEASR